MFLDVAEITVQQVHRDQAQRVQRQHNQPMLFFFNDQTKKFRICVLTLFMLLQLH